MTTPSKLDEARLRELAEALTFFGRYADETREATATRRNNNANDASKAILALLDALSAERERGDRAVGLLEIFDKHLGEDDGMWTDGSTVSSSWMNGPVRMDLTFGMFRQARAFLATQKAEGA